MPKFIKSMHCLIVLSLSNMQWMLSRDDFLLPRHSQDKDSTFTAGKISHFIDHLIHKLAHQAAIKLKLPLFIFIFYHLSNFIFYPSKCVTYPKLVLLLSSGGALLHKRACSNPPWERAPAARRWGKSSLSPRYIYQAQKTHWEKVERGKRIWFDCRCTNSV